MAGPLMPVSREMVEFRLLGRGVAVEPVSPGDFTRVDLAFRNGALEAVASRAALQQDMSLNFCTGLGTDPLNMNVGFDGARLIADETDPEMLRERLRAAAAIVASGDPRVARVVDVQLAHGVAAGETQGRVRATQLVITIIVDLITGERASVNIEGVSVHG